MKYLQCTKDSKLTYKTSDDLPVLEISDFDFADCPNDMKSTSGYIFILADGAISLKGVKTDYYASKNCLHM